MQNIHLNILRRYTQFSIVLIVLHLDFALALAFAVGVGVDVSFAGSKTSRARPHDMQVIQNILKRAHYNVHFAK